MHRRDLSALPRGSGGSGMTEPAERGAVALRVVSRATLDSTAREDSIARVVSTSTSQNRRAWESGKKSRVRFP
jgi:hypothetical protein